MLRRRRSREAVSPSVVPWLSLKAPARLTFDQHGNDSTTAYLQRIYEHVVVGGGRATIDLSPVKTMSFGAALTLVAQLNRAEALRPGNILRGILPRKPRLSKILHDMGFVAATSPNSGNQPTHSGTMLRVRSGFAKDIADTAFLDEFLKSTFPSNVMSDQVRGRLKGAVTEALLNIIEHAYRPKSMDPSDPTWGRWWICGWAHPKEGCHFVVYDLGAGIPATVPDTLAPAIREAYEALDDEDRSVDFELIKLAGRHPSSRTGTPGRGRGLPEMRRLIDRVEDGMLWITSGRGTYMYARGRQTLDDGFAMNNRLHGTLVVWRLRVSDALDDAGT